MEQKITYIKSTAPGRLKRKDLKCFVKYAQIGNICTSFPDH